MDFSLRLAYAIILCIVVLIFSLKTMRSAIFRAANTHSPPQAGGAWPILGHLHLFGGGKLTNILLGDLANKYGPAFIIRLGLKPTLVVSSWQIAKELCTTNDLDVCLRPKLLVSKHLGYDYTVFPMSPDFAYWREMRKLVSMHLFSPRRLQLLKHVQLFEMENSTKELYNLWQEKRGASSGRVSVDFKQWFQDLSLNVILRMVAGKHRFVTGNITQENVDARKCQKVTRDIMQLLGTFVVADCIPFLRWFDIGGYEKKIKKTAFEMDEIMDGWLKDHRSRRESSGKFGDQDFMDVMLSVTEEFRDIGGGAYGDSDKITKATCMAIIAGGTDTTAVMLTWALSLLMNNKHALIKAQKEIDDTVGKERRVNEHDIQNLPYLQAIVKEVLRVDMAGSLCIREFIKDCTICGFYIPKGTRLIINLSKIHSDPTVWEDPSEFRPERFLTLHKDLDVKGKHFQLIPFGAGRRICPAMVFGLQMLHLVLARLLQAFDFTTPFDKAVDMTATQGMGNKKATPLDLLISPRLPSRLY